MEASGHSVVYVGWGERVHGVLSFDDTPLAEARSTIEALRRRGLHVTLLPAALAQAATRFAAAVAGGGGDLHAGLSPQANWLPWISPVKAANRWRWLATGLTRQSWRERTSAPSAPPPTLPAKPRLVPARGRGTALCR
jgi:hypothetical protein